MMRQRTHTTPTPAPRRGFTLIEIMLALGVLGIGMVMVASIFPAAIKQTQTSDRNTKAMVIADNARAILEMHLSQAGLAGHLSAAEFGEVTFGDTGAEFIHPDDSWYPSGDPAVVDNGRYGWLALVRQVRPGANDYQVAVIPYEKFSGVDYGPDNRPDLVLIRDDQAGMDNAEVWQDGADCFLRFEKSRFDHFDFIAIGSPILLDGAGMTAPLAGRFPVIVSWGMDPEDSDYMRARLSGSLLPESMEAPNWISLTGVWTVSSEVAAGAPSPALPCSVFRTALNP